MPSNALFKPTGGLPPLLSPDPVPRTKATSLTHRDTCHAQTHTDLCVCPCVCTRVQHVQHVPQVTTPRVSSVGSDGPWKSV